MTIKELENYSKLTAEYWQIERRIQKGNGLDDDKRRLKEVNKRLSVISDFILGCSDPVIKACMIHKFIELKRWEEVAISIGGYNSGDSCRMLVIRYLNRENKK
jgi:hypothetical protein